MFDLESTQTIAGSDSASRLDEKVTHRSKEKLLFYDADSFCGLSIGSDCRSHEFVEPFRLKSCLGDGHLAQRGGMAPISFPKDCFIGADHAE